MRVHSSLGKHRASRVALVTALLASAILWWVDLAAAAGRPTVAPAQTPPPKVIEEPMPDASSPWAEVTFAAPQRFAIVTESQTKRRRL